MSLYFKAIIETIVAQENYQRKELIFLEREHIKTMNTISELLTPSIASLHICEACNLEPGSFWNICNASILHKIRPVKTCKPSAHKLFDGLCQYKIFTREA